MAHDQTNFMLLNNLAYYFLMQGNVGDAREVLERINEQDALNSVHVNATRGLLFLKEGALEKGAYYYNRAIDLAKDDETKNQALQKKQLEWGRYFLSQGKTARAQKHLQDVLTIKTKFDLYRRQAESLLKNY
jgi:Tfp pilus assembly protein PilF